MSLMDMVRELMPAPRSKEGEVVPANIGATPGAPPAGLDRDTAHNVCRLIQDTVAESDTSRRWQLQRIRKGRDYYYGKQWQVWSMDQQAYIPMSDIPSSVSGLDDQTAEDDDPVYSWNLYRATGEFISSVISGGPPTVRFFPADANNSLDVATAKAANDIVEIFHRTNSVDNLLSQEAYYLYTDGFYAAYVRHVVDKQRFGTRDEPIMGMVEKEVAPDMYVCPQCGGGYPQPACERCLTPLGEDSFVPRQTAQVEEQTGTNTVANGSEVVDLYGALEVRLPPEARDLQEARYLVLAQEVDPAYLKALYPDKEKEISSKSGGIGLAEERTARTQTQTASWMAGPFSGLDDKANRVTYTRAWVRPSVFYRLEENKRQALIDAYPDGGFFAFAGDVLLEDRNESMDDFWVICHATPGEGSMRPALGDVMLDVQDALNDLLDVEMQNARHSVSMVFVDTQSVDKDEIRQSRVRGGQMYPVKRVTGDAIGSQFWESTPAGSNPQAISLRQEVFGGITQYLTGTLPGLTGQSDPNLKTAKAYAQAREQAMGRIAVVWRGMKEAHAKIALLAVRHFIANRKGDTTFAKMTPAGFRNKTVKFEDLRGQIIAYPESDEAYPVSASDKREQLNQMLTTGNPVLAAAVTSLENFDYYKSVQGLDGLKLPGEDARNKQYKEIELLLQGQPQPQEIPGEPIVDPATGQPMVDPATGQPAMSPPQQIEVTSYPIEQITDDHDTEFRACQAWLNSDEGWDTKQSNPAGHKNVVLHAQDHFNALMSQQPPGGAQ
ncbi:MAG: hypothetical protein IPP07_28785 [Holophagales bacterium]|nr:hypothetical protein [Holophagales bacterium]